MKKILGLASIVALGALTSAASAVNVNMELSLLVDISGSVDASEFALQRTGYANAFSNPAFYNSVVGSGNSIAVNFVEWSGAGEQSQVVGWTLINSQASANAFAAAILAGGRPFSGSTSPSGALNYVTTVAGPQNMFTNAFTSDKQVIDVSGDGAENILGTTAANDAAADAARNAAVAAGVDQINGLVILGEAGLQAWYNAHIRAGAGSFVNAANTFADFGAAIAEKIRIEVSGSIPLPGAAGMGFVGMGLVALRRRRTA